jgi:hypothetical protein
MFSNLDIVNKNLDGWDVLVYIWPKFYHQQKHIVTI